MSRRRVALLVLPLLAVARPAAAQRGTTRGISFTVDTATDGETVAGILSQLSLRVTYSGGRGRIDVLARLPRPAVQAKWVTLAPTSAVPGDYYLFDSTQVVHVRPASKTFSRYQLADLSFNYEGLRDRWPFFRYDPYRPDTLPAGGQTTRGTSGNFSVFWHSELMRDTSCTGANFGKCLVKELARGRVDVVGAPAEELGVVRWIGPTHALARITGLDSIRDAPIRLTEVGHWKAASGDSVVNVGAVRFLSGLHETAVDPLTLVLPHGYVERVRMP